MPLQDFKAIRLKPEYRGTLGDADAIDGDPNRTPGKDEVAQYIQEEVVAKDRWPLQMTRLGEETGYSRQHVANVVSDYFEGTDSAPDGQPSPPSSSMQRSGRQSSNGDTADVYVRDPSGVSQITVDIPRDVDKSSYIRGYMDALEK